MCLILEKQPHTKIDLEAFKTACENNPDGYGFVVANGDGTCYVEKELKYDEDDLYKAITDDFNEHTVMLHLRYTTAGETIRRNLHPFPVLEFEKDGVDLWMCHNGTLSSWKHSHTETTYGWESDSRHFVRGFVRPLFKRLIRGMSIEEILTDPFVYALLDDQLSAASVLSFIDGFGNTLQVNALGNGGKYDKGLYYSNEYSFDAWHRKSYSAQSKQWQSHYYGDYNDQAYEEWWSQRVGQTPEDKVTTMSPPANTGPNKTHAEDTMQKTFSEKYGLSQDEMFQLTDDTLEAMLKDEPETLLDLSKELLFLLYEERCEVAKLKVKLAKSAEKISEETTDANSPA